MYLRITNSNVESSVAALSFLSQETNTDKETTNIVKNAFNKKEDNKIANQLYIEAYKKWKNKDKGVDDITIICIILK